MGILDDAIRGINALANLKKSEAEKIKAQTKKDKMRRHAKKNKDLKKALSKSTKIGIIGIVATIVVSIASVIIVLLLSQYFPIQNQ